MKSQMTDLAFAGKCPGRGESGLAGILFGGEKALAGQQVGQRDAAESGPGTLKKVAPVEDLLETTAMCIVHDHRCSAILADHFNRCRRIRSG